VVVTDGARVPIRFGYDPGFMHFQSAFDGIMSSRGFKSHQMVAEPGPTVPHAIVKRYRLADNQPFPLVQIGHGIFACNFSTDYEWANFRQFAESLLQSLEKAYAKSALCPLNPARLELRYIDIFDAELMGHTSFGRFLKEDTKFDYEGLPFLNSNLFTGDESGQILLRRNIAAAGSR
jgi:uncharacterized protein (TIGR04255 family)